jgi:hypothetical protein
MTNSARAAECQWTKIPAGEVPWKMVQEHNNIAASVMKKEPLRMILPRLIRWLVLLKIN